MNVQQILELKRQALIVLLATTIPLNLAGCKNNDERFQNAKVEAETNINSNYKQLETEEKITSQNYVKQDLKTFYTELFAISSTYNFEKYYPTTLEIEDILKWKNNNKKCQNQDEDLEMLLETIIKNSLTKDSFFFDKNKIDDYNEKQINELTELDYMFTSCLKEALKNVLSTTNDIKEDICKLETLSIVRGEDLEEETAAIYDNKNNTIIIYYDAIKKCQLKYKETFKTLDEYLTIIIQHELNHVKQEACSCRDIKELKYSDIADKYFFSIIESSAESAIYNYENKEQLEFRKTTDYVYYDEREQENLLFLLAAFKEGRSIEDYYNAIFDSNLNELFNYFDLKTSEDIEMFLKIVYSINTLKGQSELSGVLIDEYGCNKLSKLKSVLGYQYKIDIFKCVLKDLIDKTQNDSLTLEESLTIYEFVKSYIVNGTYNIVKSDGKYKKIYDEKFLSDFVECENVYFKFLKNYYEPDEELDEKLEEHLFDLYSIDFDQIHEGLTVNETTNKIIEQYPMIQNIEWQVPCFATDIASFNENIATDYQSIKQKSITNFYK